MQGAIALEQLSKIDEIYERRLRSYNTISFLFEKYIDNIRLPKVFKKSNPLWFGVGIICDNVEVKQKLVAYLEKNKIQTRNLFAGNFLLHPTFSHLDDYKKYPNANKVLDQVFFVGCAPHYGKNIFNYIEDILREYNE
jgi:CDP-6-deoxy-D-xylo-4-hexulose-3-dehydrase